MSELESLGAGLRNSHQSLIAWWVVGCPQFSTDCGKKDVRPPEASCQVWISGFLQRLLLMAWPLVYPGFIVGVLRGLDYESTHLMSGLIHGWFNSWVGDKKWVSVGRSRVWVFGPVLLSFFFLVTLDEQFPFITLSHDYVAALLQPKAMDPDDLVLYPVNGESNVYIFLSHC